MSIRYQHQIKQTITKKKAVKRRKEKLKLNKNQKNKYSMYIGVRAYLDDHSEGYSDNEEFNDHINNFKSILQDIAAKEDERSKATLGKVKNKSRMRKEATELALAVSGAIYSFAKKTGDVALRESMDLRSSDFKKFRDSVLLIELNSIKDKAAQYSADIARYGITADKLTEYGEKTAKYAEALGAKDTGSATRSGASKTMISLFREADSLLDSMDRIMAYYKVSDQDFYEAYKAARVIRDLGIRHGGGDNYGGNMPEAGRTGITGGGNSTKAGLLSEGK